MRRALLAAGGTVVLALASTAIAQSVALPTKPSNTLQGPVTVIGPVNMTTGPMNIDGGMTVGEVYVDAGLEVNGKTKAKDVEVTGNLAVAGSITGGMPATLGPPVTLNGPVTISGSASFSTPPTGLTRTGFVTRSGTLSLSIGYTTIGTISVPGVTKRTGCMPSERPDGVPALLDCHVTAPGTVTLRAYAAVALSVLPTGTYWVTLVGE